MMRARGGPTDGEKVALPLRWNDHPEFTALGHRVFIIEV
jgi:hypothetical protein